MPRPWLAESETDFGSIRSGVDFLSVNAAIQKPLISHSQVESYAVSHPRSRQNSLFDDHFRARGLVSHDDR